MLAGLYARQGLLEQVANCCERVISINPSHSGAHYNLATALRQAGQTKQSESSFRKCLDIDPGNLPALLGIGKLLSSQGLHNQALGYFETSTSMQPSNAEAFYCLGVTQQNLGNLEGAQASYRKAVRMRPDYYEALNNLGHILHEQGKLSDSLQIFSRLIKLKPDLPHAHNNAGIIYEGMGKVTEAEAAYRSAINIDPSLVEARSHLGFLLADEGRTTEALDCFNSILDAQKEYPPAVAGKAVALEKLGNITEARTIIEPSISAGSTDPDVVLAYCKIMSRVGEPRGGIRIAETLLAGRQDIPPKGIADLHFALGDLYEKNGNYAAAFSHYQNANNVSPCTYNHKNHVSYIDGIIDSTGREQLARLPRAARAQRQMIFIVGMPRSGTSLVEQILSRHPDVFGAGELRYLGDIASSFSPPGKPGASYPDAIDKLKQADVDRMARTYMKSVLALADSSPVITDKMPHNFRFMGLIALLLPGAKLIHVSRTPLDNCLSLYFHSFNPMHSYTTDLKMLGQYYREYQRLMDHWRNTSGISFIDIRYEDIVDKLEESTRRMLDFCDLDWADQCLLFHESDRFVKTPSYDQVRRPIYTSSVNRWQHYQPFIAPLQAALSDDDQQLPDASPHLHV